jgi:hypothetical protein
MHTVKDLNFSEIARRLSGETGLATYNNELNKHRKRVKRLYDKAVELISSLSNSL